MAAAAIRHHAGANAHGAALRVGLVAVLLVAGGPFDPVSAAPRCKAPNDFDVQQRVESADTVVLFHTVPSAIAVGQQFAVEAVVCATRAAGPPSGLVVDAQMPEHRHGMNYRPRVSRRPDGVFVAEGMLFHMPGQWQLRFDVQRGDKTERLSSDIEVE